MSRFNYEKHAAELRAQIEHNTDADGWTSVGRFGYRQDLYRAAGDEIRAALADEDTTTAAAPKPKKRPELTDEQRDRIAARRADRKRYR